MAWNQSSAFPSERLRKRDARWDERGLAYWQQKLTETEAKFMAARASASQARRAMQRFEEAKYAVWTLEQSR
jgi:hypothetical protein